VRVFPEMAEPPPDESTRMKSLITDRMKQSMTRLRHVREYLRLPSAYKAKYGARKDITDLARRFALVASPPKKPELKLSTPGQTYKKVILSIPQLLDAVKWVHEECGHGGADKVITKFQQYYYFYPVTEFIRAVIALCGLCAAKVIRAPPKPIPGCFQKSERAHDIHVMDITKWGRLKILNMVDHWTRFIWGIILDRARAVNVVKFLYDVLSQHFVRIPLAWFFDNGKEFLAHATVGFGNIHGIQVLPGPPYTPERQGVVESIHKTTKREFSMIADPDDNLEELNKNYQQFLLQYNKRGRKFFRGLAPIEVLTGHYLNREKARMYMNDIEERLAIEKQARECHAEYLKRLAKSHPVKEPLPPLKVDTKVLVVDRGISKRIKKTPKAVGLGKVVECIPNSSRYRVEWLCDGAKRGYKTGVVARAEYPRHCLKPIPQDMDWKQMAVSLFGDRRYPPEAIICSCTDNGKEAYFCKVKGWPLAMSKVYPAEQCQQLVQSMTDIVDGRGLDVSLLYLFVQHARDIDKVRQAIEVQANDTPLEDDMEEEIEETCNLLSENEEEEEDTVYYESEVSTPVNSYFEGDEVTEVEDEGIQDKELQTAERKKRLPSTSSSPTSFSPTSSSPERKRRVRDKEVDLLRKQIDEIDDFLNIRGLSGAPDYYWDKVMHEDTPFDNGEERSEAVSGASVEFSFPDIEQVHPSRAQMKAAFQELEAHLKGMDEDTSVSNQAATLKKADADRCLDTNWFNDELINAYSYMLQELVHSPAVRIMTSWVWWKCVDDRRDGKVKDPKAKGTAYYYIQKSPVDVNARFIVFPVHANNMHWCLCILDVKNNKYFNFDSLSRNNSSPMEGFDAVVYTLRLLLPVSPADKWTAGETKTPRQPNGCDCGAYTLACLHWWIASKGDTSPPVKWCKYFRGIVASFVLEQFQKKTRLSAPATSQSLKAPPSPVPSVPPPSSSSVTSSSADPGNADAALSSAGIPDQTNNYSAQDESLVSVDGLTSPNRIHLRVRRWLDRCNSPLLLCHVVGDGDCGWYALWMSLWVYKCTSSPVLNSTPNSWNAFKMAALQWAKDNLDRDLNGYTLRAALDPQDLELLEEGKWQDIWCNFVLCLCVVHLWHVEIRTYRMEKVQKKDEKNGRFYLVCDVLPCPEGEHRATCSLVHNSKGEQHYDVLLPKDLMGEAREDCNGFKGLCSLVCKK
jgi:transposase InsO family protein